MTRPFDALLGRPGLIALCAPFPEERKKAADKARIRPKTLHVVKGCREGGRVPARRVSMEAS